MARPVNSEILWHIQKRLIEKGHNLGAYGPENDGADGDLGPETYWDESRTLNAMLSELGGPVEVDAGLARGMSSERKNIYLDIGHGQKPDRYDSGAVHAPSGTTEHHLNTVAANACADRLRANGYNAIVNDDKLKNYSAGRQSEGCDVFISFHHNASGNNAQGAEALYHATKGNSADKALAELIAARMAEANDINNRGGKPMRLSVLSGAEDGGAGVAVLTECYFMDKKSPDNPPASMMEDWSTEAGYAVADAIMEHLG